jgi:Meiotically Up-regulated Gene 113 (MUG113) protein
VKNTVNEAGNEGDSVTVELPEGLEFRDVLRLNDPEANSKRVYFLYCAGFVKIGMATSVTRRMTELQIGSPWKSQIVLLIPGGKLTESYLHSVFRDHRQGGEWFRLEPPVKAAIREFAPPECVEWLEKEDGLYREWIRLEAIELGLMDGKS